jgi:hypothetical protein
MKASLLLLSAIAAFSIGPVNAAPLGSSAAPARTGCSSGTWPAFSTGCRNTIDAGTHYVDCAKKARDLGWEGNGIWWYCSSLGYKD